MFSFRNSCSDTKPIGLSLFIQNSKKIKNKSGTEIVRSLLNRNNLAPKPIGQQR
jgi:hypothetical protein